MDSNHSKPPTRRLRIVGGAFDVLLGVAALGAAAVLVLEYGFRRPVVDPSLVRAAEIAIVCIFALDRAVRLAIAPDRVAHFFDNAADFVLMGLAAGFMLVAFETALALGALYVLITQAHTLAATVLRGVARNMREAGSGIHPAWLLAGSFALLATAGSGLLMLPVAVNEQYYVNWYYVDALFTSTSATCLTGLAVRGTGEHFTVFGQVVILALIQCGGLAIMIFGTAMALALGRSLNARQGGAGETAPGDRAGGLARTALCVAGVTLLLELAGAAAMQPMFARSMDCGGRPLSAAGAAWYSAFHSISAFCNAGFSLYGDSLMAGAKGAWGGAAELRGNWQVLGVLAPLIVLGGLGFPVLQDCARWGANMVRRAAGRAGRGRSSIAAEKRGLSLHSKLVLTTTAVLILGGSAGLLLIEGPRSGERRIGLNRVGRYDAPTGDWSAMPWPARTREAVFQSVTARTAGFNTINMAELSDASKLTLCGLMVVGGSPASTAGGIKTVTAAVLVLLVWSQLRRRREVGAFGHAIATGDVMRAVTLTILYGGMVTLIVLGLCAAQGPGFRFIDLLFEACSACGSAGLSTGVTAELTETGKGLIITGMFVGRIGPLMLAMLLMGGPRGATPARPAELIPA